MAVFFFTTEKGADPVTAQHHRTVKTLTLGLILGGVIAFLLARQLAPSAAGLPTSPQPGGPPSGSPPGDPPSAPHVIATPGPEVERFLAQVTAGAAVPDSRELEQLYAALDEERLQALPHEINLLLRQRGIRRRFGFETGRVVELPLAPAPGAVRPVPAEQAAAPEATVPAVPPTVPAMPPVD